MTRLDCALSVTVLLIFVSFPIRAQPLQKAVTTASPDGRVTVQLGLSDDGGVRYAVRYDDTAVLRPSPLGLETSMGDWRRGLSVEDTSESTVTDAYRLHHGKQSAVQYEANRRVLSLVNRAGQPIEIVAQVSNHGVALRYRIPEQAAPDTVVAGDEHTGFRFAEDTRSWLMPMDPPDTGWSETFPSYEAHYVKDEPTGQPAPRGVGWAFPGLFRTPGGTWALVTEAGLDGSYHASRLDATPDGAGYRIAGPQPGEGTGPADPVDPSFTLPFASPWRLIAVGDGLGPIVESTLPTDVSPPSTVEDTSVVQPGTVAWSWLPLKDESINAKTQRRFIDMAAEYGFEYALVDNLWDQEIGYEGVRDLVAYADERDVGLFLWYNSNGSFNEAPQTPRDRMHTTEARREEFARLEEMGIEGVKVDFFGGDKQSVVQLYRDIYQDAAAHDLMVNVHGSTLPRGEHRTYPNFMTSEAVRGYEYITFGQEDADRAPTHATMLPFTRNVVGPMDFTPTMLTDSIGNSKRRTSNGFDLAMAVVFESGLQHFGVTPESLAQQPDYVGSFLGTLPAAWDETQFLDGFPGQFVVLARRHGDRWYVAGLNGQDDARTVTVPLDVLDDPASGRLITDDGGPRTLRQESRSVAPGDSLTLDLRPHGGFVMELQPTQE
ncbi:MAG: glycoside hydrolase family 97 catalytic domain-containing protein [Salinivenus sp.]